MLPLDDQDHVRTRARVEPSAGDGPRDAVEGPSDADRERLARLAQENEQLTHAIASRPVIDMARGVLMASFDCSPDQAWEILVEVSQRSNIKLRVVAEAMTEATTRKEPLPESLRTHVAAAVARQQAATCRGQGAR